MRTLTQSGFRVWSRTDVQGILSALEQTTVEVAACQDDSYELRLFNQGYSAALRSIARMFGVDSTSFRCPSPVPLFRTIESQARIIS